MLLEHNLELLRGTKKLRRGIFSVLNGVSRKSMIGEIINSKNAILYTNFKNNKVQS